MTFDDFIRQCAEDCVNMETKLDDRPVAGFADASDEPEVQAAIRDRDLAELRKPLGEALADEGAKPDQRAASDTEKLMEKADRLAGNPHTEPWRLRNIILELIGALRRSERTLTEIRGRRARVLDEDSARLDWLERHPLACPIIHDAGGWVTKETLRLVETDKKPTLREAIDAARGITPTPTEASGERLGDNAGGLDTRATALPGSSQTATPANPNADA